MKTKMLSYELQSKVWKIENASFQRVENFFWYSEEPVREKSTSVASEE